MCNNSSADLEKEREKESAQTGRTQRHIESNTVRSISLRSVFMSHLLGTRLGRTGGLAVCALGVYLLFECTKEYPNDSLVYFRPDSV